MNRPPNLIDYEQAGARFRWDEVPALFDGLSGRRELNVAHEAVDRHAHDPLAARVAFHWTGRGGARRELAYGELTSRFPKVLERLGGRK